MSSLFITLLVLGAIALVAAVILVPSIRRGLFIRADKAGDQMSTDLEKEEYLYKQEVKNLEGATKELDELTGKWQHEINVLNRLKTKLQGAENDYDLAVNEKMPDAVINSRVKNVDEAEKEVNDQAAIVNNMKAGVDAANDAVARAERALRQLEGKIKSDAGKAKLAAVFSKSASVIEKAKDTGKAASEIGKISDRIDENLEKERAKLERQKGPKEDQDFERLAEEARLRKKREELEARRNKGNQQNQTPPQS